MFHDNLVNLYDVPDLKSWLQDEKNVYIGRQRRDLARSKWANKFKVQKYGREKAVSLYERHLRGNKQLLSSVGQLKGKTLGCWCFPDLCHGVVLNQLAGNSSGKYYCADTTNAKNTSKGEFWVKLFF